MPKIREKVFHWAELFLFNLLLVFLRFFPESFLRVWEKRIIGFLIKKSSKRAEVIRKNLRLAFSRQSEEEREKLLREIYRHFYRMFTGLAKLQAGRELNRVLQRIEISGAHHLHDSLNRKRGVIIFSAHFGNWELIPLCISELIRGKLISIAKPAKNMLIEKKIRKIRYRLGSEIIEKRNAIMKVMNALRRNRVIYLLVDQNAIGKEAVLADFFGIPTYTNNVLARLYLKNCDPNGTGLILLPAFLIELGEGRKRLEISEPVSYKVTGNSEVDIRAITQILNDKIEKMIRQFPQQWFWFHDRWKNSFKEASIAK